MQFPGLGSELNPDPNPNLNLNLVETERQTTVLSKQNPFRSGGFFFCSGGLSLHSFALFSILSLLETSSSTSPALFLSLSLSVQKAYRTDAVKWT